eukprot:gb/GEZJ01003097.1/.p1 GENE.gb/GEZJ01003097.1/~~gb/GEZJ01003097.1/.p1  ORF type:complete len:1328 (+),score=172.84 gb/GEZJ01003097.1/:804-4787(+)
MDLAEPKNDLLWRFIGRSLYLGLITFGVTAFVAFLLDYCRRYIINYGPRNLHRSLRRLPKLEGFFMKYRGGNLHLFFFLEVIRFALNLLVCFVYVHGTYLQNVSTYMKVVYGISSRLLVIDAVLRLLSTESAFSSVFSLQILVDSFSYPSMWIADGPNAYLNLAFLRAVSLYLSYLILERLLFIRMMSSKRLLLKLLVQNLVLFYTLAGAIQLLEIPGDLLPTAFRERWFNFGEWTFLNSCYFIIVTLSTVGYGDFSPSTLQGRIFTLFIIIIGIVIFASIVSELVTHARRRRGSGWFVKNKNTRHVIITGSPNRTDLIQFISEFFSDSRGSNKNARIVVLVGEVQWSDSDWYQYIAKNYFLQNRVQYMHGSVGNSLDLSRAGIETADAVFILSSFRNGEEPSIQDTETVMSALAIRNIRTDIPIYAQTILENSNLQTYTALITPSTFSKEETYFRGKEMSRNAAYTGLYFKVLELEYETIPELQRKGSVLRRFEEHVHRYLDTQEDTRRNYETGRGKDDLARSQLVCLQEIQMALISGNVRANGVGTLLSNMYLDVQTPEFSENEPPWLSEYHMGASCELAYAIVPKELDGVAIKDLATELCQLGLIIVAISDVSNPVPRLVLNTDALLSRGDLVMVLTYHELGAVAAVLNIVALRYAKLRREKLVSTTHPPLESMGQSQTARENAPPNVHELEASQILELGEISPSFCALLQNRRNQSGDDLDALFDEEDSERIAQQAERTEWLLTKAKAHRVPEDLKDHVIIAPKGEGALDTLTLLLANLWKKDVRMSVRGTHKAKVVVVHPCISSEFSDRLSRVVGQSLFFVEGPSTSRATWRKARIDHAKAVVTTADYRQKGNGTDAQTLLTLLALDVVTKDDQNLFICSELVEERSLEYLREPLHPRRKVADLGDEVSQGPLAAENRNTCSTEGASNAASAVKPQAPSRERTVVGQGNEIRQESTRHNVSNALHGRLSQQPLGNLRGIIPDSPANIVPEFEGDPAAKPGAVRARRSVLFSRSRYASGELLVQSNAITLLAREYIEPGFINLFTNILGTNSQSFGMKIRLIRIPPSMFDSRNTAGRGDLELVRYEKIFNALIRLGVTPLGIYRSGTAPALLPTKSRKKRGAAVLRYLGQLTNESLSGEEGNEIEGSSVFIRVRRLLRRVFGTFREVLPSHVQEQEGRNEVHGRLNGEAHNDEMAVASDEDTSSTIDVNDASDADFTTDAQNQLSGFAGTNEKKYTAPADKEGHGATGAASRIHTVTYVLGQLKYTEKAVIDNLLPYVYTHPDLNTLCAKTDGVFVLCDPCFDLPANWRDTFDEVIKPKDRTR